jgi:NADPH-dependent curcumin reductase CurA
VVEQLRPLSRIALCGQMSGLAGGRVPPLDIDWYLILTRSLTLQGFRTVDYIEYWPEARRQLAEWFRNGELRQGICVVEGLEKAGAAFEDLLNGRSVGKTIVNTRP